MTEVVLRVPGLSARANRDDSLIRENYIADNDSVGIGVVDYCLAVGGTPFDCSVDPSVIANPGFLADQAATGNRL